MELKPGKKDSLKKWTMRLDESTVRTWDRYGGTRLGTTRVNPFDPKKDKSEEIIKNYKALGLDALVVIVIRDDSRWRSDDCHIRQDELSVLIPDVARYIAS